MRDHLSQLIFYGGIGHLLILVASAMVPTQLNWRETLKPLPKLVRQLFWVYGGYVVLSIVALGLISIFNADELAAGGGLARAFCFYVAMFWGIRLSLQAVFDVKMYLNRWWLRVGYHLLTLIFVCLTLLYGYAALS